MAADVRKAEERSVKEGAVPKGRSGSPHWAVSHKDTGEVSGETPERGLISSRVMVPDCTSGLQVSGRSG